jgi:hypothetical protein
VGRFPVREAVKLCGEAIMVIVPKTGEKAGDDREQLKATGRPRNNLLKYPLQNRGQAGGASPV